MEDLEPSYKYYETKFEFHTKYCNNKCHWKVVTGANLAEKVRKHFFMYETKPSRIVWLDFETKKSALKFFSINKV